VSSRWGAEVAVVAMHYRDFPFQDASGSFFFSSEWWVLSLLCVLQWALAHRRLR